jgi:transposase
MTVASNSTTIRSSCHPAYRARRKNHLFAGSDGGGARRATVCSLIATAKLNNVEPFAWLSDVLQRMTDGHPANRLDELLPWNWQPIN